MEKDFMKELINKAKEWEKKSVSQVAKSLQKKLNDVKTMRDLRIFFGEVLDIITTDYKESIDVVDSMKKRIESEVGVNDDIKKH